MRDGDFKNIVWNYYKKQGRHDLPWRKTQDPYKILVSEIMLQQTQVERVLPYYKAWVKRWPSAKSLAAAPLSDVFKAWQGLGYNRRAKALHECAKILSDLKVFPRTRAELVKLPGIGDYTAGAILTFAFDESTIFIETNIRTAVTHHFFHRKKQVHDAEVAKILGSVLPRKDVRGWYWALMDYGAYLKKSGVRINSKATGYVKQSRFTGSDREVRGAIVRRLIEGPASAKTLCALFAQDRYAQVEVQLTKLLQEGLLVLERGRFVLPS